MPGPIRSHIGIISFALALWGAGGGALIQYTLSTIAEADLAYKLGANFGPHFQET